MEPWYKTAYRRNVIDMHITDWDEAFLSLFDPQQYVEMLRLCQARSAVVYAHSHVGHCYYPTQIGHMHRGLLGRNMLAEVIAGCHAHNIAVVVYFSLIYDDYAYRHHPDWNIVLANGKRAAEHSRYGVCCPNSPYRDYARAHVQEICRLFDFEGLRFDMTFWPAVCYCPYCQSRFAKEVGGELPRTIAWDDPRWVAFQRHREAWLVEFAALMTSTVKTLKPEVSVEHQSSTYPLNWRFGVTTALAAQNDLIQGDFYGDALQGSFVRKLFHNLSPNLPYGFETSSAVDLRNHTALKSLPLLRAKAHACLADGGAFVFIDAINPDGTLNRPVYERMGQVFQETQIYEPFLGGELVQDVGVYLSTESKFDPADSGKAVDDARLSEHMPHVEAALGTCKALISHHIPYGVITRRNLHELGRRQVLVLPNVLMMDDEEAAAIREYVQAGGALYASRATSLLGADGRRRPDFALADLFGVSYRGQTRENFTYIAPAPGAEGLFPGHSSSYPLGLPDSQIVTQLHPGTEALGYLTLPYTDPADTARYASIHSNPPGQSTMQPAVVCHKAGKGQVIYVATDLERYDIHQDAFIALIKRLAPAFAFEADAPSVVEVTAFHQPNRQRFILSLINFQRDLPNIPIEDIRLRVRLNELPLRGLTILPQDTEWPCTHRGAMVEFNVPRLEVFQMFALYYGQRSAS